jgi:thiol reductant ABC exporter CydC subunit
MRALLRVAQLERNERPRLALSVLLSAAAVAAACGLLATSGYLISRAAQRPAILSLGVAIVCVRAFALARATLRYGDRLVSHDLAFRVLARLRLRFFTRLVPLVPGAVGRRGDLLSGFVADVDSLQDVYLRGLAPPLVALLTVVGAGVAAWLILPAAGPVIAIALLLAATIVPTVAASLANAAARRQAPARAALTAELVESIDGATELALAGRAPERAAQLRAHGRALAALARRDSWAASTATVLGSLLSGVAVVAVLLVAVPAVHRGALAGVLLAAIVFLALAAFEGVAPLPAAAQRLRGCAAAAERLEDLCAQEPAVADPPAPVALADARVLSVEGVRFRYEEGTRLLLHDVSFTLPAGERLAVVGTSGTGKTTLGHLLARFLDPQAGRIALDGVDLRLLAQDDVRRLVLLAGQPAHVFSTSLRENLLIADRGAGEERLWDALRRVRLEDWARALPQGLDTFLGQNGETCSGGERQRIALARALLAPARFVILDEPTAHLDEDTAEEVLDELLAAFAGRGVLLITHSQRAAARCERVLELREGTMRGVTGSATPPPTRPTIGL